MTVLDSYPICNMLVSALSTKVLRMNLDPSNSTDAEMLVNIGIARMNLGLPFNFVPQVERYLEAAILAAPGSDIAKIAYAYLEELAYFLYGDPEIADEVMNISLNGLKLIAEIE